MTSWIPKWHRHAIAVGLLAALGACGGGDQPATPGPVPTPTPTPAPTPTPGVLISSGTFVLKPNGLGVSDFTTDRRGTLDVEIRYKLDTSDLLFWVTDRKCNRWQFERDECFYLVKSLEGPNPRKMTAHGVAPGTYTLFAANDNKRDDEEMDFEIVLTPE